MYAGLTLGNMNKNLIKKYEECGRGGMRWPEKYGYFGFRVGAFLAYKPRNGD